VHGIRFTSEFPVSRRAELERLVFFNANQHRVDGQLREALHRYGAPSMVLGEKLIRFAVPKCPSVQTLYALDESDPSERLAAVAIYTREEEETLSLIFLALHEEFADGGARGDRMLAHQVLELLRASAARTHGVRWLRLAYHPKDLRIAVRRQQP
jgi:hypothetical protein